MKRKTSQRLFLCLLTALFAQTLGWAQKPELVTQEGHTSIVLALAFSPNGKLVASGSHDKKIKLWDVTAGMEFRTMGGNGGTIMALIFIDNQTLISADDYGNVRLWDVNAGKEVDTLERLGCDNLQRGCPTSMALSSNHQVLAIAGKSEVITLWDLPTRTLIKRIMSPRSPATKLAFSPVQDLLAAAGKDGTITLWNISDGTGETLITDQQTAAASSISFSPNGKYLVTGSHDTLIRIWSVQTRRLAKQWAAHAGGVNCAIYNRAGTQVISGGNDNTIKFWDVTTGREMSALKKHTGPVQALVVNPSQGNMLASGGNDSAVRLWDVDHNQELVMWGPHTYFVKDLGFTRGGTILATAHGETLKLWNVATGHELRTLKRLGGWIYSLALSPDGSQVATGSGGEHGPYEIHLWDVSTGRETLNIPNTVAYSLAFSLDGKTLASGSHDGKISLWDVQSGALLHFWRTPSAPVNSVAWTTNGQIVSGSGDGGLRVWGVGQPEPVKTFDADIGSINAVDLSPDGKILAGRGSHVIKLWDLQTGQTLPISLAVSNYPAKIRFSPDGKFLAVGDYEFNGDQTVAPVRLWDVKTGALIHTMTGHTHGITSVAFSRDGSRLVSGSWDNTWRIWDVKSGKELCTVIALDVNDWVAVTPEGRFDGSPNGQRLIHWRVGNEVIGLEQLKERYYEPGLISKILGFSKEPLREVDAFREVKLYPGVEYAPPTADSAKLTIKLTDRGGGIGRVRVLVNGKEVTDDARGPNARSLSGHVDLPVDLSHAAILSGQPNYIQVFAWNAEGYLSSRGEKVEWNADALLSNRGARLAGSSEKDSAKVIPELYAIVAGISDYDGDALDLKFAAKDAEDMATALELGAKRLFGAEKVHLTLLSTSDNQGTIAPTKANFRKAFEEARKAKPEDILVVYLAGHGVTLQRGSDTYYYLTQEARTTDNTVLSDPAVRERTTITSEELVEWTKHVPALKQVMVLDTCAAGAAAARLVEKRDVSGDAIRAIDRLKDRTGFHVLMGSAVDAVSYEASQYGQGLLTYALLQAMKGAALREGQFADVETLFQYAADHVPELARGIGGIQRPIIAAPTGTSFDVGQFDEKEKQAIPLAIVKPLILRPILINPDEGTDNLGLIPALRKRLNEESYATIRGGVSQPSIVYVDADEMPSAVRPSGTYTVEGNRVKVKLVLSRDGQKLTHLEIEGSNDVDSLAARIVESINQALK